MRYVALESLPLVEQLRAVLAASVLVGMHGQGMLWTALLPSERSHHDPHLHGQPPRRASALEIFPQRMLAQNTHAWHDYRRWAFMNGVEYFALVQPDAPACADADFRLCGHIVANVSQTLGAVRVVAAHAGLIAAPPAAAAAAGARPKLLPLHELPAPRGARWHARARFEVPGAHPLFECIGAQEPGGEARACVVVWRTAPARGAK